MLIFVHVTDKGSEPKCVEVMIGGVPCFGIVDNGADISIMGGKLLQLWQECIRKSSNELKKLLDTMIGNHSH